MAELTTNPADAGFLRFRDDAPHDEPAVTLDAFLGQSNATAVRLEAGDDARALLPYLDRIALVEVSFPSSATGAAIRRHASCARPGMRVSFARRATCWSTSCCRCGAAASTALRRRHRSIRRRRRRR